MLVRHIGAYSHLLVTLGLFYYSHTQAQTPATLLQTSPVFNSSIALADLNGDGYTDILSAYVFGYGGNQIEVRALDGRANYANSLPGWPVRLSNTRNGVLDPTVAVGRVDPFSNDLWVIIGAAEVHALRPDGTSAPGFPSPSLAPPFYNAPAFGDVNNQGVVSIIAVDESTYEHRFNPLGKLIQAQCVGDQVVSSPAIGDVGRKRPDPTWIADGLPDIVAASMSFLAMQPRPEKSNLNDPKKEKCDYIKIIRAFDSRGHDKNNHLVPPPDQLFEHGELRYLASPALADLDDDGTQDIIIQGVIESNNAYVRKLQLFLSTAGLVELELSQSEISLFNNFAAYSSPAVIDIGRDKEQRRVHDIYIGSDSGHMRSFRYTAGVGLTPRWSTPARNLAGISASPLIVTTSDHSEQHLIVFASSAGYVYVLDADDGAILKEYSLRRPGCEGEFPILSTPAVGARNLDSKDPADQKLMIVAANSCGIFRMTLDEFGSYDPQNSVWPTFHRNNERVGSLDFALDYDNDPRGSVGGITTNCSFVELRAADGSVIVRDGYNQSAETDTIELNRTQGRYLYELITSGQYRVRFNRQEDSDQLIEVSAGQMTRVDFNCP